MDRRQQKTRAAILDAFAELLSKKNYDKITVKDIIDRANVGRSTFYAHFETKEALLQVLCSSIFDHVIESAKTSHTEAHSHGKYSDHGPRSVFCHILYHLEENDHGVLELLEGGSGDIFLRYFKNSLKEIAALEIAEIPEENLPEVPEDFLIDAIASSFAEMVHWWTAGGRKETPEELDRYFHAMMPFLS